MLTRIYFLRHWVSPKVKRHSMPKIATWLRRFKDINYGYRILTFQAILPKNNRASRNPTQRRHVWRLCPYISCRLRLSGKRFSKKFKLWCKCDSCFAKNSLIQSTSLAVKWPVPKTRQTKMILWNNAVVKKARRKTLRSRTFCELLISL